jgi:hypothetical protein
LTATAHGIEGPDGYAGDDWHEGVVELYVEITWKNIYDDEFARWSGYWYVRFSP